MVSLLTHTFNRFKTVLLESVSNCSTSLIINIPFQSCPPPVPSSPQRGLADRMFLDGPATRISTCMVHCIYFCSFMYKMVLE